MTAIAYLELTDLHAFVEELKRRGLREARLCGWIQRYSHYERRKLRLTAIDKISELILRNDTTFYHNLATNPEDENDQKKLRQAKKKAEQRITTTLAEAKIRLLNGEYHMGEYVC